MDKDFMLNYYDKMVRPTWTELMKTPRYQRAACERDKIEREFRRLLDEKLGRKYLELDDALFRVMDDIAEAMYILINYRCKCSRSMFVCFNHLIPAVCIKSVH